MILAGDCDDGLRAGSAVFGAGMKPARSRRRREIDSVFGKRLRATRFHCKVSIHIDSSLGCSQTCTLRLVEVCRFRWLRRWLISSQQAFHGVCKLTVWTYSAEQDRRCSSSEKLWGRAPAWSRRSCLSIQPRICSVHEDFGLLPMS
jgi:hypothetical protein